MAKLTSISANFKSFTDAEGGRSGEFHSRLESDGVVSVDAWSSFGETTADSESWLALCG